MTAQQVQEGKPDRGIINEEGVENKIPLLGWRQSDALFVASLTIFGFIYGIQYGVLWVLTTGIGLISGVLTVYAKPSSLNIFDASKIGFEYLLKPEIIRSASKSADPDVRNEGGLLDKTPFQPEDRSQDLTAVKLAFPGESAVLTEDGRMERVIEVHGESMDFAPPEVWGGRQSIGQELANRVDADRFKLSLGSEEFEFGKVVERLEKRMEHPDIKASPAARQLLEDYYEERPRQMQEQGLQESRFFIVIAVAKKDVSIGYTDEPTPAEKLSNVPVVGSVVDRFVSTPETDAQTEVSKEEELHKKMIDKLDDLSRQVEDNYITSTDGYTYRRLTSVEVLVYLARFNNNPDIDEKHVETIFEESMETNDLTTESRGIGR